MLRDVPSVENLSEPALLDTSGVRIVGRSASTHFRTLPEVQQNWNLGDSFSQLVVQNHSETIEGRGKESGRMDDDGVP